MSGYRAQGEGRRFETEIVFTVTTSMKTGSMTISSESASKKFADD